MQRIQINEGRTTARSYLREVVANSGPAEEAYKGKREDRCLVGRSHILAAHCFNRIHGKPNTLFKSVQERLSAFPDLSKGKKHVHTFFQFETKVRCEYFSFQALEYFTKLL